MLSFRKFTVIKTLTLSVLLSACVGKTTNATDELVSRPIIDTHIHLYERFPERKWPKPGSAFDKESMPEQYQRDTKNFNLKYAHIIGLSGKGENNILEGIISSYSSEYPTYSAYLDMENNFGAGLAQLLKKTNVVGVRVGLGYSIHKYQRLADAGLVMDVLARERDVDNIINLAQSVPNLRIVVNHLLHPKGSSPSNSWAAAISTLAKQPNIYIKFSSLRSMTSGSQAPPSGLSYYKPFLDIVMQAFGSERIVWGSNWPVIQYELGGSFAREVRLAEEYLDTWGQVTRDKIMYRNALKLYQRTNH